jgi:integrase
MTMRTTDGELFKKEIVRWIKDGKRVSPNTPDAERIVEVSKKWYVRLNGDFYPLAKDKDNAKKMLRKLATKVEQKAEGLDDPYEETAKAPIANHIDSYLNNLKELGRDERYRQQLKRLLNTVKSVCGAESLKDLTSQKVDTFLAGLNRSARTKNSYRAAVVGLYSYLFQKRLIPENPMKITTRARGQRVRIRRALGREDLQKLIEVARTRPLIEAMTFHRGPKKGQLGANVSPEYCRKLEQDGRHLALHYKTAILTGLRWNTLRKLKVGYLKVDYSIKGTPFVLDIPGCDMKSRRDFRLVIRDDLVNDLKSWIFDTNRKSDDQIFDILKYSQGNKVLRKVLKMAGIPYQDADGRYFDFHSFRKCTGTFLRTAGIDRSISMGMLDHSTPEVHELYNDKTFQDISPALAALPDLSIDG